MTISFMGLHRIASENLVSVTHARNKSERRDFLRWAKENGEAALKAARNGFQEDLANALLAGVETMSARNERT